MAGRIQGITVEIGGDTTKLQTERLSIKRRSGSKRAAGSGNEEIIIKKR